MIIHKLKIIKRITDVLIASMFILLLFPLFGNIMTSFFGYSIKPVNTFVLLIFICVSSIAILVMTIIDQKAVHQSDFCNIASLLLPLFMIYLFFFDSECERITVAYKLRTILCLVYLCIILGESIWVKKASLILSGLLFIPLLIFLTFGHNNVVFSCDSPDGRRHADVIVNDQGALGGETSVDIYEYKDINLIMFSLCKKPLNIYNGDWDDYKKMTISWKDNTTVIINSKEYKVE